MCTTFVSFVHTYGKVVVLAQRQRGGEGYIEEMSRKKATKDPMSSFNRSRSRSRVVCEDDKKCLH